MQRLLTRTAALCCLTLAPALVAQGPTTLPGTEQFALTSEHGALPYRIDVQLPPGYAASASQRYPVFYLLDSNLAFAIAVQQHRMLGIDRLVPPMIIVGIGYPEDDPAVYTPMYAASRTRDYTPTAAAGYPGSGQAAAFLSFIREQLIPTIDRKYRTDPADRALGGHSFGGLFTTYALLHEPSLFQRYWLGSPSLWWDGQVPFQWLPTATEPPKGTRVFLSVGAMESDVMVPPMQRMAAGLKARFPRLEVTSMVYPAEHHGSVVAGSISRALGVLYARPTVPIAPRDARALQGKWISAEGQSFSIRSAGGRLVISDSYPGIHFTVGLKAYTRDELFDESLQTPYVIQRDGSGAVTAIVRRAGMPDSIYHRTR